MLNEVLARSPVAGHYGLMLKWYWTQHIPNIDTYGKILEK